MASSTLGARIEARARQLGFDVVGFARADQPLTDDFDRYVDFVERGRHGEMEYLASHREARRRLDTEAILPGARAVVCVGQRYARPSADGVAGDEGPGVAALIARYARGRDYHNHLRKRLRALARFLKRQGEFHPEGPIEARVLCDVEPLLEKAWAARAGLGFIGKNGLLIAPGEGSYLLLGEVVTNLDLVPGFPMADRCGACTRCLDACPTDAFAAPFVLDATRCISYLTIERSEPVPEADRERVGTHLFGCDVCQEVCPYNAAAPDRPHAWPPDRDDPFAPLPGWRGAALSDVVGLDEEAHRELTMGSPLRRPGRIALAANALVVAVNRACVDGAPAVRAEAARAIEAGLVHPDPRVRDVARWGRERLGASGATAPRDA